MHRSVFIDFTAKLSSAEIWDVCAVFKVHPLDPLDGLNMGIEAPLKRHLIAKNTQHNLISDDLARLSSNPMPIWVAF